MITHDIDEIFRLLENPTRRRILRLLSMETHYPLQLARELGISQQAVGKHIKILEDHGMVRSFEEPSSIGGPPRRSYVPNQRISMRVDLGPGMFQTFFVERKPMKKSSKTKQETTSSVRSGTDSLEPNNEKGTPGQGGQPQENRSDHPSTSDKQRLHKIAKDIQELNHELQRLEEKRIALLNTREELLQESRKMVLHSIPDYLERKLIYYLLERGPTSLEDISEIFDRRIKLLEKLQLEIENEHGLTWLFQH